jgi:ketosteroid isomerase-like protein
MADHPNADLIRRAYAAFQQGDLDTVRSLFDATSCGTRPATTS